MIRAPQTTIVGTILQESFCRNDPPSIHWGPLTPRIRVSGYTCGRLYILAFDIELTLCLITDDSYS